MIKKQTINEIYLSNGIEIQQYVFYCTASNTTLGGVLEAIDTQGSCHRPTWRWHEPFAFVS